MGKEYRRQQFIKGMTPAYGGLLCYDNFEGALAWKLQGTAGGNKLSLVDYQPFRGGSCMEIYMDDETPTDGETIGGKREFQLTDEEKLRVMFMFKVEENDHVKYVSFEPYWQTQTRINLPGIRFDVQNNKVQYKHGVAAWTDLPGGTFELREGAWIYVEVLLNIKVREYVSVNLSGREFDMSGIEISGTDGAYADHGHIDIKATQEGTAGRAKIWVDELVILSE